VVSFRKERTHHPSVVDVVINDESKKLRTVSLSEPARGMRFSVSARGGNTETWRFRVLSRGAGISGTRRRTDEHFQRHGQGQIKQALHGDHLRTRHV
jgi:hypothetical protein